VYRYHPDEAPDPEFWLSLDEQERIQLAEAFHRSERVELPNLKAHATFHAMVENQIAEGLESVLRAMARLERQGLSRHDALHAIAWVLAKHFFEVVNAKHPDSPAVVQARYDAAVERLDANAWREQGAS